MLRKNRKGPFPAGHFVIGSKLCARGDATAAPGARSNNGGSGLDPETELFAPHHGNGRSAVEIAIEKNGWHLVTVPESPESPGWAFTVGLQHSHAHPEIVIVGWPAETMEAILEALASDIAHGAQYRSGTTSAGVLEDLTCEFRAVDPTRHENYLAAASRFYGDQSFTAVQCVWPGPDNRMPDAGGAEPMLAELQPLLQSPHP